MTPEQIAEDERRHAELLKRSEAAGKQTNGRHTPLMDGYPREHWGKGLFPSSREYLNERETERRERAERSARSADDPENKSLLQRSFAARLAEAERMLGSESY